MIRACLIALRLADLFEVDPPGRLILNDSGTMLLACRSGAGIAQILALGTHNVLKQGQLVEIFPDWADERFPLYALHPSRHRPPAKVRAFIDFALAAAR